MNVRNFDWLSCLWVKLLKSYILYGIESSIEEAKYALEELLIFKFEDMDGDYHGGRYFLFGNKDEENFQLKRNIDPFDHEPFEMKFPDSPTLFYINATLRGEKLEGVIERSRLKFSKLRSENFE